MLLPSDEAMRGVRRVPWMTALVAVVCGLVYLTSGGVSAGSAQDGPWYAQMAGDYWRAHPYLRADNEISARVSYDVLPEQRVDYLAALVANRPLPSDPVQLAAEQAHLERLTDLGLGRATPRAEELGSGVLSEFGYIAHAPRASTLVTHSFVHVGWVDFLTGMGLLLLLAPVIERRLGSAVFAGFFLTICATSALFHAALTSNPQAALVGSMGALAGLLGGVLVAYPSTPLRFEPRLFFGSGGASSIEVSAWMLGPLFVAVSAAQVIWLESIGMGHQSSWLAQIGGFVLGGLGLALFSSWQPDWIDSDERAATTPSRVVDSAVVARASVDGAQRDSRSAGEPEPRSNFENHNVEPDAGVAANGRGYFDPTLTDIAGSVPLFGEAPVPDLEVDPVKDGAAWSSPFIVEDDTSPVASPVDDNESTESMLTAECGTEVMPPPVTRVAEIAAMGASAPEKVSDPDETAARAAQDIPRFTRCKCVAAIPVGLVEDGLRMWVDGSQKAMLDFDRIDAVTLVAITGLGDKTVLLVDLLLDWRDSDATTLRLIRLSSPDFDPRSLVPGHAGAVDALRAFVAELADRAGAVVLPAIGPEPSRGFVTFAGLAAYEREVLQVDSNGSPQG